jgi:hypothetical protein
VYARPLTTRRNPQAGACESTAERGQLETPPLARGLGDRPRARAGAPAHLLGATVRTVDSYEQIKKATERNDLVVLVLPELGERTHRLYPAAMNDEHPAARRDFYGVDTPERISIRRLAEYYAGRAARERLSTGVDLLRRAHGVRPRAARPTTFRFLALKLRRG